MLIFKRNMYKEETVSW